MGMYYTFGLLFAILNLQYGGNFGAELIAIMLVSSAIFIYWLVSRSLVGITDVRFDIDTDFDPWFSLARKATECLGAAVLIMAGDLYALAAFFSIPYILMTGYAEIFGTLVHYGFIVVIDNPDKKD